jgi:hypothetical protein
MLAVSLNAGPQKARLTPQSYIPLSTIGQIVFVPAKAPVPAAWFLVSATR